MSDQSTGSGSASDQDLLNALRRAAHVLDPPPEGLREAALRAHSWDLGLGRLVEDSVAASSAPAMRSGAATVRDHRFAATDSSEEILVTIEDDGSAAGATVHGLLPAGAADLVVVGPTQPAIEVDCSETGRFTTTVAALPVALSWSMPAGTRHRTPLISLND